jgi:Uma2 family endonuclease
VAFVAFERLDPLTDEEVEEPPIAPDVAVEIRSSSYRESDAAEKIELYLRHGTLLVLDVDPQKRCIVAHSAGGACDFAQDAVFEHETVPWLRFEVAPLFSRLEFQRASGSKPRFPFNAENRS